MSDNILSKAPKHNYSEPLKEVSWEAFSNILENRRSTRVYLEESIPDEIVQRCLSAALLAPTSSNLQCWEFYWVKTEDKKKKLADICLSQPAATTAPVLIACIAKPYSWKENRKLMLEKFQVLESKGVYISKSTKAYYEKLVPFFYSQGPFSIWGRLKALLFFFRGFKSPTPREPTSSSELRAWAIKTTALACQNLMMAFSASGYDTCPMEGYDSHRLKKLLGLGCESVPVMVISAGKRAPNGIYGPRIRFEESRFIKVL